MTRLAAKLNQRVSVVKPTKVPNNETGGFDRSYNEIAEVWAEIIPIAQASQDIAYQAAYIRGNQVKSVATHKMRVRRIALIDLGKAYTSGFSSGFSVSGSLEILKSEYYILRQRGADYIGNLFRILTGVDNDSDHEYLNVRLKEVEEQGLGEPE